MCFSWCMSCMQHQLEGGTDVWKSQVSGGEENVFGYSHLYYLHKNVSSFHWNYFFDKSSSRQKCSKWGLWIILGNWTKFLVYYWVFKNKSSVIFNAVNKVRLNCFAEKPDTYSKLSAM